MYFELIKISQDCSFCPDAERQRAQAVSNSSVAIVPRICQQCTFNCSVNQARHGQRDSCVFKRIPRFNSWLAENFAACSWQPRLIGVVMKKWPTRKTHACLFGELSHRFKNYWPFFLPMRSPEKTTFCCLCNSHRFTFS